MPRICLNLVLEKLRLPMGWWSFFWAFTLSDGSTARAILVNSKPAEAENLPKTARQEMADKP
jgi:hypothetical protein